MFRFVVIAVLAFGLFAGFMYFQMFKEADRFMNRVQIEGLEAFDTRNGLRSIEETVRKIAEEEMIILAPAGLEVKVAPTAKARAVAATGVAPPVSGSEAIVVTASFKVSRSIFSQTFTRTASKTLHNPVPAASGRSSGRSSGGGMTGGVNMSRPTRDVNSHRQSVKRAVGGHNP
ncbi:hypothetical protein JXA80_14790 [bacterium]|nr:hypothetical protein [candidate division CSSED10-310 bacterium]